MTLRLTNTLTRKTEEFIPQIPNKVNIYCCGVTVYDDCHLGHARSYIAWDILRRYLIWIGYEVTFIQNFTDIDDKILKKASEEDCSMEEISQRNIVSFHRDMDALGIIRPDRMPRATKCLDSIRNLIEELESIGVAYSVDGDVYFSVMKSNNYGKLSRRNLNDQQQNADGRVKESEEARKKHPFDFALWKAAKPGEPSFSSKWGEGRPGWHIECSAMVREELGHTIDIHLGGADLIFPHHENEIAQSEAANGCDLSRYWLHNGMVNVDGQKMSKSLGNFTTIKALLEKGISSMTLRYFVLQANYRKPLDFTDEGLKSASKGWEGLNLAFCLGSKFRKELEWPEEEFSTAIDFDSLNEYLQDPLHQELKAFKKSMDDDLNTSGALAILFELARPLRSLSNKLERGEDADAYNKGESDLFLRWQLLRKLGRVLGLQPENDQSLSDQDIANNDEETIQKAIYKRKQAKLKRDFDQADLIREELRSIGIELIDKPNGVTDWRRI